MFCRPLHRTTTFQDREVKTLVNFYSKLSSTCDQKQLGVVKIADRGKRVPMKLVSP